MRLSRRMLPTSLLSGNCSSVTGFCPSLYSNKVVTASVYLLVASGTQNLNLYLLDASPWGGVTAASSTVVLNSSWQRFELTGTLQPSLTSINFQIGGGGTMTSGQSLLPEWGNSMEHTSEVTIPQGATVYIGPAAAYSPLTGGGIQVFVPNR